MAKRETLYRASMELHTEGRTLTGLAMPWDKPTRVVDPGTFNVQRGLGGRYLEALAPTSTDVTRSQHESFPVFVRHDYMTDPVGVVAFQRSSEGLVYEAPLSATKRADEMLELVNDGAMRSVSLGYFPLQHVMRRFAEGATVYRTEVGIREMSLAPTGFGQYAEARVLAVRDSLQTDQTFDAITDAVKDAIVAAIGASDDGDGPFVYVRDMSDAWCVYEVEGGPADLANAKQTLYKVAYEQADDGTVTVSDPEPVQVSYVPTAPADTTERANLHADLVARRMRADRGLRSALLGHTV